jgi:hypothetical protein
LRGKDGRCGAVRLPWHIQFNPVDHGANGSHAGPPRRAKAALWETQARRCAGSLRRGDRAQVKFWHAGGRRPRGLQAGVQAQAANVRNLLPHPKPRVCGLSADDVRGSYRRHFHDLVSRGVGPNDAAALAIKFASGTGESSNLASATPARRSRVVVGTPLIGRVAVCSGETAGCSCFPGQRDDCAADDTVRPSACHHLRRVLLRRGPRLKVRGGVSILVRLVSSSSACRNSCSASSPSALIDNRRCVAGALDVTKFSS